MSLTDDSDALLMPSTLEAVAWMFSSEPEVALSKPWTEPKGEAGVETTLLNQ